MTDILIGTHSRNSWQRPGTTATLRIWFSGAFRDTNGDMITPGNGTSSFYDIIPCTVNAHIVTIPPFTLPSTLDGFPANIQSFGRLYDASGAPREFLWGGWSLSNAPTSLPFDTWFVFNQGSSLSTLSNSLQNRMWVTALVDSLLTIASQGIVGEIPSGPVNGINNTFILSATPILGSVMYYLNGRLLQEVNGGVGTETYTISGGTITSNLPPQPGDNHFVTYRTATTLIASSAVTQGIISEVPTGIVNGVNQVFGLSDTPVLRSLLFFINGRLQTQGNLGVGTESYTVVGNDIHSYLPPQTGDQLYAYYLTAAGIAASGTVEGTGTLVIASATTILSTSVATNSPIDLIPASDGITGRLRAENRVPGVSFNVVSENGADSGSFKWILHT